MSLTLVVADVAIVSPGEGDKFSASGDYVSIKVLWNNNNDAPSADKFKEYKILLCSGSNSDFKCNDDAANTVQASDITKGDTSTYQYNAKFKASLFGNGQYFLQMVALITDSQYTIHYSPRFSLASMAGTSTPKVSTTSQPGPEVHYQTGTKTTENSAVDTSKSFTVPYTLQTGLTRYAPMQMQPTGSPTATTWTRKFPSSAVTYYSTLLNWKSLQQVSTITPGWSYIISSDVNWATPAPNPSQNGGWYNPKSRQSLTTRKKNSKNLKVSAATSSSSSSSTSS